jgi:hypothetical protein
MLHLEVVSTLYIHLGYHFSFLGFVCAMQPERMHFPRGGEVYRDKPCACVCPVGSSPDVCVRYTALSRSYTFVIVL